MDWTSVTFSDLAFFFWYITSTSRCIVRGLCNWLQKLFEISRLIEVNSLNTRAMWALSKQASEPTRASSLAVCRDCLLLYSLAQLHSHRRRSYRALPLTWQMSSVTVCWTSVPLPCTPDTTHSPGRDGWLSQPGRRLMRREDLLGYHHHHHHHYSNNIACIGSEPRSCSEWI